MSDVALRTTLATVVHVVDDYAPTEVVINWGASQGVKLGDRFLVFGEGPRISDPGTGRDLGQLELVRGRGEVVHVQDRMATIRTIERRRTRPAKRIVREGGGLMARYIGGIMPSAPDRIVEEEIPPETDLPFDAVRVGDLAKPI